jgi:hypothetical protein
LFNLDPVNMFSFGIFSSHIPYIIVTAVYLLYYVFCALNSANSAVEASVPDTGRNHAVSCPSQSDELVAFYATELIFDQAEVIEPNLPGIKTFPLLSRIVYLPDKTLLTKFVRNPLLPRSPPLY